MNATIEAGRRTIIKRAMRKVGLEVENDASDDYLNQWAKGHPGYLVDPLTAAFERAAQAWIRGNNSGDNAGLREGEAECDRCRQQAESVLTLFGVTADYPGLYPTFEHGGHCYHELKRCLEHAAATHRVTRDGTELYRSTADECFVWLLHHQGQSVDWACKHGGYAIEPIK